MILVFGGAYQGKKEYIESELGICGDDIYVCRGLPEDIESDAASIYGLERWVYEMVQAGEVPEEILASKIDRLTSKVISIQDVSQGLVPMDAKERAFRESNGRCMVLLAEKADEVYRIFCGIPQRLK